MIKVLHWEAQRKGVEVSRTGAVNFLATLRDAGVVDFTGWNAEGKPEFEVTALGSEILCPECAAPAKSATERGTSGAVLRCAECGTQWLAAESAVEAVDAFQNAVGLLA